MPKKNVLDTRSSEKERLYKQNVLFPALRDTGKGDYAELLKNYNVKITADTGITGGAASIDADKSVIYLDPKFAYDENTELLAALIKHEILHSLLNHLHRGFNQIASDLGIDPKNVSREDWERIYTVNSKINHIFNPIYGGVRTFNIAADLDLARLYTSEEIEQLVTLGGLIREDYPEYENMSYEEIRDTINKEERTLKWRLAKKVVGTYNDETGTFEAEYDEENEFDSNIINWDDIKGITLPKWRWVDFLKNHFPRGYALRDAWFIDKNPDDDAECIGGWNSENTAIPVYKPVTSELYTFPVLQVRNLNHYTISASGQVQIPGDSAPWLAIPIKKSADAPSDAPTRYTNYIIRCQDIGWTKFNSQITKYNDFKGSDIEIYLNNWIKAIKNNSKKV